MVKQEGVSIAPWCFSIVIHHHSHHCTHSHAGCLLLQQVDHVNPALPVITAIFKHVTWHSGRRYLIVNPGDVAWCLRMSLGYWAGPCLGYTSRTRGPLYTHQLHQIGCPSYNFDTQERSTLFSLLIQSWPRAKKTQT